MLMETKHKELYEAPAIEVVEPDFEGVICASADYTGFGNEEDM